MSETIDRSQQAHRRSSASWWIVTVPLALALLGGVIALQLREPDIIVRQVPSSTIPEPTAEMLDQVEKLDAESAELSSELIALLRFVVTYECPPGTAPSDVQRLEELKRKAEVMLAGVASSGAVKSAALNRVSKDDPVAAALPATANSSPLSTQELSNILEGAVVFVLPFKNKQIAGSGTGFFIGPDLIVTNSHVIESADRNQIVITNSVIGDVIQADVVANSGASQPGDADYALLRTRKKVAPAILPLSPNHNKLMEVLVAGYPGLGLVSDSGFRDLLQGDLTSAPDMHQNKGVVRSTQDLSHGVAILHTADVQTGYSGGPLIDLCGRVIGINTFIQVDTSQSAKINSALASAGISGFLQQLGAQHTWDSSNCDAE